jgi:Domain of unknown function (DUF4262)
MCELCDGKSEEQVRRALLARIARNDYTMVNVREERARDRSWVAPGFVYSIGLWSFRRVPDVIVVGAPGRHGVELVTRYAELARAGRRLRPGGPYVDLLPGPPVMVELVAPSRYAEWFTSAFDFYPTGDFPAYQLLWPDRDGNWPWQAGWRRREFPQPVLTASGRPESWPAEAVVR